MPFDRVGPYRIGFYSYDVHSGEPPHVHVMRDNKELKIWLNDLTVHFNNGFKTNEERKIIAVVTQYQAQFLAKWEAYNDRI
ncbi:DUF4160 domain-containing protein [Anaerolineales bacterium HSG6]|nr:DUF4160 domain-containing protein [Anaerolineales bacterium HSG6]